MAYRRRHGPQRSLTFVDDLGSSSSSFAADESPSPSILAAQVHSHSSTAAHHDPKQLRRSATYTAPKGTMTYEYTSMRSLNESKYGFWGILARKAKAILEDDIVSQQIEEYGSSEQQKLESSAGGQEGLRGVENTTADKIKETRKLHIRRKSTSSLAFHQTADFSAPDSLHPNLNDQETQLKASRDVANAMAAKAKLLLRELKTVKADLAFAKERSAQLEEENKLLRESLEKGDNLENDDLIRLQLETLLEEKARLAHENSIYARENRFLREIVEYHQLTMQDVIYVDEGIEEVTPLPHLSSSCCNSSSGHLSPISESGFSNNSSPRSFHVEEITTEGASFRAIFSTTSSPSSPLTPSGVVLTESKEESPLHSPRHEEVLKRQSSLTRPRAVLTEIKEESPLHSPQQEEDLSQLYPLTHSGVMLTVFEEENSLYSPQHEEVVRQQSPPSSPGVVLTEINKESPPHSPQHEEVLRRRSPFTPSGVVPNKIKEEIPLHSPQHEEVLRDQSLLTPPRAVLTEMSEIKEESPLHSPQYEEVPRVALIENKEENPLHSPHHEEVMRREYPPRVVVKEESPLHSPQHEKHLRRQSPLTPPRVALTENKEESPLHYPHHEEALRQQSPLSPPGVVLSEIKEESAVHSPQHEEVLRRQSPLTPSGVVLSEIEEESPVHSPQQATVSSHPSLELC